MMKKILSFALVAALSLGVAASSFARPRDGQGRQAQGKRMHRNACEPGMRGPGGMHGGGMHQAFFFELGLSDKQILKLQEKRMDHQKKMLPKHREMYTLHEEMAELRGDPVANEARMKAIASRLGEMRVEMGVERAKFDKELRAVLTAEQIEKLGDRPFMGRARHHRPGKGGRDMHRMGMERGWHPDCPWAPPVPDSGGGN